MPKSMTGFGIAESNENNEIRRVEIRGVNSKGLDLKIRLPNMEKELETEERIKKAVSSKVTRGRIDLSVVFKRNSGEAGTDELMIDSLKEFRLWVEKTELELGRKLDIRPADVLSFKTQLDKTSPSQTEDFSWVNELLEKALAEFTQTRNAEGEKLGLVIQGYLSECREGMDKIKTHTEGNFQKNLEKLTQILAKCGEAFDENDPTLRRELAFQADRVDISEELERFNIHLGKANELIQGDQPVGRRFEILLQEMNREVNTMGSKSSMIEIIETVMSLKGLIEKIREQVLNLE